MAHAISESFNLAEAICRRHADSVTRVALLDAKPLAANCYTFGGLDYLSDKFASTLRDCGIKAGDAVAVSLDQSAALVVAELGALKCGAVVVPLSPALEISDVETAINDSRAKALIAPFADRAAYAALADRADSITTLFLAGDSREAIHYEGAERSFWRDVFLASSDFIPVSTEADAPAFIFYLNTGGSPRRVIHTHAAMLGRLADFERLHDQAIGNGNALWCGEDWAAADLRRALIYPAWWCGCAVVTQSPNGLTSESALRLLEDCDVTSAFLREGLLDGLLRLDESERARFNLKLRTVIARDEVVIGELGQRVRERLGAQLVGISSQSDSH